MNCFSLNVVFRRIFSFFGACITALISSVLICFFYGVDDIFGICMFSFVGPFICSKIIFSYYDIGYRVPLIFDIGARKWSRFLKVIRAPFTIPSFVIINVLAFIILYLSYSANFDNQTCNNLKCFSWIIVSAIAIALAHWVVRWQDYFCGQCIIIVVANHKNNNP